jgi:hypothetical protein
MKGIANPHFEAGGLQIRQNKNNQTMCIGTLMGIW